MQTSKMALMGEKLGFCQQQLPCHIITSQQGHLFTNGIGAITHTASARLYFSIKGI